MHASGSPVRMGGGSTRGACNGSAHVSVCEHNEAARRRTTMLLLLHLSPVDPLKHGIMLYLLYVNRFHLQLRDPTVPGHSPVATTQNAVRASVKTSARPRLIFGKIV
mmetsp:Transcript_29257/g.93995  ORF Transcript_29257/g.93995 Transcript_29257/m.93995 type:complete len:107 (+) Transcript_29257:1125-1445(+)